MKKRNTVFTNLALALLLVPGGTFAWFTDDSGPVMNEFNAGTLLMSINDNFDLCCRNNINPGDSMEKSVVICNDGNNQIFVRVVIDAKFENDLPTDGVVSYELGEGWIKEGKYYYFNTSVGPDSCTPALFTKICFDEENMNNDYNGKRFSLIIISESIQASNGAAEAVWGAEVPDMALLPKEDYGPCLPISQISKAL